MYSEAQLSLWILLIAFFTLMALQVHFAEPLGQPEETGGRSRRRSRSRGGRTRARK